MSDQLRQAAQAALDALLAADLAMANGGILACHASRKQSASAIEALRAALAEPQPEPSNQNDWMWEDCSAALESMTCPWCERQGIDICQHADDAKNCEKTK